MRIIFDRNFNRNLILPFFLLKIVEENKIQRPQRRLISVLENTLLDMQQTYTRFNVNLRKARDINKLLNSNINTIFQYIFLFETKETSICTWMYKIVSVKSFREEESS